MTNNIPTPSEIKDRLATDLHISHLEQEEQAEIISKISTIILDRLSLVLMSKLPKETLDNINTLLESDQTDVIQAIIQKHVPDISTVVEEVVSEVLSDYNASIVENTRA